jgi:hypothetical protein
MEAMRVPHPTPSLCDLCERSKPLSLCISTAEGRLFFLCSTCERLMELFERLWDMSVEAKRPAVVSGIPLRKDADERWRL